MTATPSRGIVIIGGSGTRTVEQIPSHTLFWSEGLVDVLHLGSIPRNYKILVLTPTGRAGCRLPKSAKMLITAEMSTIAQK